MKRYEWTRALMIGLIAWGAGCDDGGGQTSPTGLRLDGENLDQVDEVRLISKTLDADGEREILDRRLGVTGDQLRGASLRVPPEAVLAGQDVFVHAVAYQGDTVVGVGDGRAMGQIIIAPIGDGCDKDGDTFLDCDTRGCCASSPDRDEFSDCVDDPEIPAANPPDVKQRDAAAAHPYAAFEKATDYALCNNGLDDDCAGGDIACAAVDADEDGVMLRDDCNDDDPTIGAGLPELPGDGIDQDCDGIIDEAVDLDGDGYSAEPGPNGGDCDDTNPRVHPNRGEVPCNEIDDDCDGGDRCVMDDIDGDGVLAPDDCDDFDAGRAPGLIERCGDGIDQDCDGADLPCPADDADGDGFGPADDCRDDDPTIFPGAPERCGDGVDQDCDGGDLECPPPGQGDLDGDGFLPPADCDDDVAGIRPGAPELCDRIDNDCDGRVDEGNPLQRPGMQPLPPTCGVDEGVCRSGPHVCSRTEGTMGAEILCFAVEGSEEICDGFDNDCDGTVDLPPPGQERLSDEGVTNCGPEVEVGNCRIGKLFCANGGLNDCRGAVEGSPETCDGTDEDCDERIDEGERRGEPLTQDCFDGDPAQAQQGICTPGTQTCVDGVFEACVGQQLPGEEVCDAIDNDCDGLLDEGVGAACYTFDPITQDVGRCQSGNRTCQEDGSLGACENQIGPRPEQCNNLDDDCDGLIDQYSEVCFGEPGEGLDLRQAGTGICLSGTRTCVDGAFSECVGDVTPRPEICNRISDDDCDGRVDEGFDLLNDVNNCGDCGVRCGPGQACCNGGCRDLDGLQNCGGCGVICDGIADACAAGNGGFECRCGAGAACEDGLRCVGGECVCLGNDDCADDELCCDGECQPTGFGTQCEACGVACEGEQATACEGRSCRCGDTGACDPDSNVVCAQADGAGPFLCRGCGGDEDCATDAICCNGVCRATDPTTDCEACGRACDLNTADFCFGTNDNGAIRDCRCGSGDGAVECTDEQPFCKLGAQRGDGQCVDCRVDTDCDRPGREGLGECVDNVCRACDPTDQAGCGANELCCGAGAGLGCIDTSAEADGSCERCGTACDIEQTNQCASRTCGCGNNAPCDINSDTPLCDDPRGVCVQCRDDVDCIGHPGGGQCVNNRCEACDPDGHDGCNANELCCTAGRPVCQATSAVAGQCEACDLACDALSTNQCASRTCGCGNGAPCGGDTPVCDDAASECVECTADVHCNGNPNGSQCVNRECRRCDPSDHAGCNNNQLCCGSGDGLRCTGTRGGDVGQCESCGVACGTDADRCTSRDCRCGGDEECSGGTPFCPSGTCVECRDNSDCGPEELCCEGTCEATGEAANEQCTACGVACDQDSTSQCAGRSCGCGDGPPCAGGTPFCTDGVGATCVNCRDDGDCGDANATQCVNTACTECDPTADDAGYVCAEDGATPICQGGTCEQCSDDADCAGRPGDRDQCVAGRCEICDPATYDGCPAAQPVCDGGACRECDGNDDCLGALVCSNGRCEGCNPANDEPCGGATPICDGASGQCEPCSDNQDCVDRPGAENVCVLGECRLCNPNGHDGCGANELCCNFACQATDLDACTGCGVACSATGADACDGRTCECGGDAACGGNTPFCTDGNCIQCRNNADCTADGLGQCVGSNCVECNAADGANDAGCNPNSTAPTCVGIACAGCRGDADCADNPNGAFCQADGSCGACDPGDNGGCGDPAAPICAGDPPVCRGCQDDAECPGDQRCVSQGDRAGQCAECDPADNDGCGGDTPICNPATAECAACTGNGQCANPRPICTDAGSCQVCELNGSEGCNVNSGRPHCRAQGGRISCRACTIDDHCASIDGAPGGQCLANGTCAECDANDNAGCDPSSATPICDAGSDTCRGCNDDTECSTGICEGGRCVQCRNSGDCGAQVCRNNVCIACGLVSCDGHPYGSSCQAGECGCANNDDCFFTTCGADNRCDLCENDADCDGNTNGEVCGIPFGGLCGCSDNTHCGRRVCHGGLFPGCDDCDNANPCTNNPNGPICAGGLCGCNDVTECEGRLCAGGVCADCVNDGDCAGHPRGENCGVATPGVCGCANANDCGSQVCTNNTCKPCDGNADCQNHPSGEFCRNGACQAN